MSNLITRLRRLPEAEQDYVASEVEELLGERPARRSEALYDAIEEGSIANASRDRREAAMFDLPTHGRKFGSSGTEPWGALPPGYNVLMQHHRDGGPIRSNRARAEVRLSELLQQTKSTATLDDIKRLIFGESDLMRPAHYFSQLLALFETPEKSLDDEVLLPIIEDAWNYFPHLSLHGRSPAELFAERTSPDAAISRLSDMKNPEIDDKQDWRRQDIGSRQPGESGLTKP